jgi:diadenosine tetraphosphate (Ap4A) HIT family hydrolase
MTSECLSCLGLAGTPRISPGPPIYVGRYWQVEHAYPSKLVGWLVLALRRHATALHELTPGEFDELGPLLERTVQIVHAVFGSAKEYAACYAEARGFEHIHFHVVPRGHDLPQQFHGAGSFDLIRVSASDAASRDLVKECCEKLRDEFLKRPPRAAS